MADAYGVFVFTKSKDCEIEEDGLVQALNSLRWDLDGGEWILDSDNKSIYHSESRVQYPTVIPEIIVKIECYSDDDEKEYFKCIDEMTDEDWDNFVCEHFDEIELSDIKERLIKHIKNGWIEISCVSNEKSRYVTYGSLRVEYGGKISRRCIFSGGTNSEIFEETA